MKNERLSLEKVAQLGQDLYYRNYKHESEFFDEVHFLYLCCSTYAKLINDMFQEDKKRNKDSDGFSYVNVSGPWLVSEDCEVKQDGEAKDGTGKYLETKMPVFCFDFDALASSVHSVLKKVKGQCGDLMRISNKDLWKLDHTPKTSDIFWYQMGERILLPNLTCDPGKLHVNYIPALLPTNPTCTVPETMVDGIITTVLQIMFGAKNETPVVKMANNSNMNTNPASDIPPEQANRNN